MERMTKMASNRFIYSTSLYFIIPHRRFNVYILRKWCVCKLVYLVIQIDKKTNKSLVELTIHEGRNHQVRKMFEAIGYQVLKLKREKYANLDLKGLKPGEYRKLTNKEIAILYSMVK